MAGLNIKELAGDLILNIVNIVVLFIIIKHLLYKPIRKFLDARKQKLKDETAALEKREAEAAEAKQKAEEALKQTESERRNVLQETAKQAQEEASSIREAARAEAQQTVSAAKLQAAELTEQAKRDAGKEIADTAFAVTRTLLKRNLDSDDNRRLVETLLDSNCMNGDDSCKNS